MDRLAELQGAGSAVTEDVTAEDQEIQQHMQLYTPIKAQLQQIEVNIQRIESLKALDKDAADPQQRKQLMQQLNQVMQGTNQAGDRIKHTLLEINRSNEELSDRDSVEYEMRDNLYQTHVRRFHTIMNEYNMVSQDFKEHLKADARRRLHITSNMSEEQIDRIVESGKAEEVLKEAFISADLQDTVLEIEERHQDILALEQQIHEVYELFKDLATLVDQQQESLDVIENRVRNAKHHAQKGELQIIKAEKYQEKARKRKCCLIIVLLVVLAVIIGPVLGTSLGSS